MRKCETNNNVVRLARRLPRHGSELEQDGRLRGPDATVLEAPNAAELAGGYGRMRGKAVNWTREGAQLRCAAVRFGNRQTVYLLVEKLRGTGWDWHVWVQAGWTWSRYGLAETAKNAREQAERALVGLMHPDTGGNALLCRNCRFVPFSQRNA